MHRRQLSGKADIQSWITQLETLLQAGGATQGMRVQTSRGGLLLYRNWLDQPSAWPTDEPDRRFRLSPLGAGQFGLSLWRNDRWERLPFEGTIPGLVEVMNSVLAHWACE